MSLTRRQVFVKLADNGPLHAITTITKLHGETTMTFT